MCVCVVSVHVLAEFRISFFLIACDYGWISSLNLLFFFLFYWLETITISRRKRRRTTLLKWVHGLAQFNFISFLIRTCLSVPLLEFVIVLAEKKLEWLIQFESEIKLNKKTVNTHTLISHSYVETDKEKKSSRQPCNSAQFNNNKMKKDEWINKQPIRHYSFHFCVFNFFFI